VPLFRDVLLVCDEMQLLGGAEFALDGCKRPSNASKEWSGTIADLRRKQEKIEQKVRQLCAAHIAADGSAGEDKSEQQRRERQIKRTHKGLNRFTLRGQIKVTIQWLLYCMVHNIEKIAHYGLGFVTA
jgi:hypothetical protein